MLSPPPKRPVSTADLTVSILALVLTVMIGAGAALTGLFLMAFLDHCPPETCSAEGAVTAIGIALGIALIVGILGLVVTVAQLVRRKPAWPFAVGTLAVCGMSCLLGVVGYFAAVGA